MKRFIIALVTLVLLAPLNALAATWTLDPAHTTIGFKVKHLMITNVKGVFEKFNGTVIIDDRDITKSTANVSIDIKSINTNIAKRDEHLRSSDFFNAAQFPVMTFISTRVEHAGSGELLVHGNLTIKGVTKPVVLKVEGPSAEIRSPQGDIRRGASATATINRQAFGVSWNKNLDGGGVVVADEVTIMIDTELVKQK